MSYNRIVSFHFDYTAEYKNEKELKIAAKSIFADFPRCKAKNDKE
jgi:hypothetical protein